MEKKVCQSCGMPMKKDDFLGTNKNGSKNHEYCTYCFQNGEYTAKNITMAEMVEICAEHMKMPKFLSRMMMKSYLPKLKRWSNK